MLAAQLDGDFYQLKVVNLNIERECAHTHIKLGSQRKVKWSKRFVFTKITKKNHSFISMDDELQTSNIISIFELSSRCPNFLRNSLIFLSLRSPFVSSQNGAARSLLALIIALQNTNNVWIHEIQSCVLSYLMHIHEEQLKNQIQPCVILSTTGEEVRKSNKGLRCFDEPNGIFLVLNMNL